MPWIPIAIGAGMGLISGIEQNQQESAQRKVAATTIANSPWTGANINDAVSSIHPAKFGSALLGGAMAGAAYSQGGFGPAGGNSMINNISGAAGAATALTSPQNGYGNPYQVPNADMNKWVPAGGGGGSQGAKITEYGFGPSGTPGYYGKPWDINSPYWNNPQLVAQNS